MIATNQPARPRLPLTRSIAIAWLALLTTVVIADHFRSKPRTHDESSGVSHAELATLQQSLSSQGEALETLRRHPALVTQSSFLDAQQKLEVRLTRIEQALEDSAPKTDVGSLQEHLSAIETRVAQLSKPLRRPSAAPPSPGPTTQEALTPPFLILGAELRGGEHFLSLLPTGTQTIKGVHLLRPGESEGEWLLEALDTNTAVFHVRDRIQRIQLP